MKKKFVLTLALVLMVAASLVAATPIEVSGTFTSGYDFEFTGSGVSQSGSEADLVTLLDFTGDFWKVSLDNGTPVLFEDEDTAVRAVADIYLDKALAEQGVDMGDITLTLSLGNGVDAGAPSVYADLADFVDDYGTAVEMNSAVANFGITLGYADLVTVYASADPTLSDVPFVIGATFMPVDGVEAAVGLTADYTAAANTGLVVSAKADIEALAGLDFALVATGEMVYDLDASDMALAVDAETSIEGIGLWVAYYNSFANVNMLAAEASYSTTVKDFDLSASFKAEMLDLSDVANTTTYTIAAGAGYSMGGVDYALDAEYVIDGTFTLSPSVTIAF